MSGSRICSERNVLPSTNDEIEVLWELHGAEMPSTVWWKAAVIESNQGHRHNGAVGTGVIRYDAFKTFAPSVDAVEFLPGRSLRVADQSCNDQETCKNDNPPLSWRAYLPNDTFASKSEYSDLNQDRDWGEGHLLKRTTSTKRRESDTLPLTDVQFHVKRLRESHTRILTEMFMLRQQVNKNNDLWHARRYISDNAIVERVTAYLRNRLSIKMQKPVKRFCKTQNLNEDTVPYPERTCASSVRLRADCDLDEFEAIARIVKQRFCGNESTEIVSFCPEFSMTQNAGLGEKEFFIAFPNIRCLFECLGITSKSDRIRMLQRYGSHGKTTLLRLIGTYISEGDEPKPCSIVPGRSCTGKLIQVDPEQGSKASIVLRRDSTEWNFVDRRYSSDLYRTYGVPTVSEDVRKVPDINKRSFLLRWRRDTDSNNRIWSKQICRSTRVTGSLELVLPCVLIPGDALVDEVEKFLDDVTVENACE